MDSRTLDVLLAETYQEFDVPVDQFFAEKALTEEFVSQVRVRAGDEALEAPNLMRRLMNLRKRGLLPRLRRDFHGRNVANNNI